MATAQAAAPLDTFAEQVESLAQQHEDFLADTREIGFYVERGVQEGEENGATENTPPRGTTNINIEGVTYPNGDHRDFLVNDHMHQQIAGRLGVPYKFYERLRHDHPDLLETNVRALLVREHQVRMIRTIAGTGRAYLSDRYRRLDHFDLFKRAIRPALGETRCEVKGTHLTDLRMYIKVLFPDLQDDVKAGDTVFGGILITNSEVGAGAFAVEPLIWQVKCTNGWIVPIKDFAEWGLRKQHVGRQVEAGEDPSVFSDRTLQLDDAAFFSKVHDVVKNAATGIKFAAMVSKMRDLAGTKVEGDPVASVQRLASTYSLSEGERGMVLEHLIEGADLSAYGFVNAVTRTAHGLDNYDRQVELERLGGVMLATPATQLAKVLAAA